MAQHLWRASLENCCEG